jgi:hypothetical protein
VFNATFNNISSDIFCILVEEMGVLVEKHRPVTSHFGIGKHINTTHKLNDSSKYYLDNPIFQWQYTM